MIEIFSDHPIILLFVVASLGYLVGSLKIKGSSLGVAAVLFVGLVFGAIDPRLKIPEIILQLGLSIFVYSIGLSSGPAFFNAYRRNGMNDFGFIIAMLAFSGILASLLWFLFGFSAASIVGIYTGSTTNTAAMAGVIDLINNTMSGEEAVANIQDIVVAYSFSYPMGVLGGIIAILILEKWMKIDYEKERQELRKVYPTDESLEAVSILVTNPASCKIPLRDLVREYDWNVVFGRVLRDGEWRLAHWDARFEVGDLVVLVGGEEEVEQVIQILGERSESQDQSSRKQFDSRRIFVSNPEVAGRSLATLNISEKYNAIVTRIRRGDIDMLAKSDTVLEIGDRVRFIASVKDLKALSKYFGDSYRESSRINLFSFGLGIGLGLILGSIQLSLGSQLSFNLGYAGGPLIVGLVLGALRRTGPIVWTLPYGVNVTLQQIGLIFLLSTIGVRSGNAFVQSLSLEGLWFFLGATFISLITAFTILFVGYKVFKKPFSFLTGVVANQPAILDFATSRSNNNIPMFGYSMMFPIGLIMKIVIAQILFLLLS